MRSCSDGEEWVHVILSKMDSLRYISPPTCSSHDGTGIPHAEKLGEGCLCSLPLSLARGPVTASIQGVGQR